MRVPTMEMPLIISQICQVRSSNHPDKIPTSYIHTHVGRERLLASQYIIIMIYLRLAAIIHFIQSAPPPTGLLQLHSVVLHTLHGVVQVVALAPPHRVGHTAPQTSTQPNTACLPSHKNWTLFCIRRACTHTHPHCAHQRARFLPFPEAWQTYLHTFPRSCNNLFSR